jgi:hypothetical protein
VRRGLAASLVALVAAAVVTSPAFAVEPAPTPVPSLTPAETATQWEQLAGEPPLRPLAVACTPLRAVFYAATDWLRLATKLAASPSPCAQYYISVPPLTCDKTQPRADQAWRIRALGPNFHVVGEAAPGARSSTRRAHVPVEGNI